MGCRGLLRSGRTVRPTCLGCWVIGMTQAGQPVRVFVDTNVILNGAFGRRTHMRDILDLDLAQFVSSTDVLDGEVRSKIADHAVDALAEAGANICIDTFIAEFRVEVADVFSKQPSGDQSHALAAAALQCEWICTYNLKDFMDGGLSGRTLRPERRGGYFVRWIPVPILSSSPV